MCCLGAQYRIEIWPEEGVRWSPMGIDRMVLLALVMICFDLLGKDAMDLSGTNCEKKQAEF